MKSSELLEVAGLMGAAVAVALLAGAAWGLLAASIFTVVIGVAIGRGGEDDE